MFARISSLLICIASTALAQDANVQNGEDLYLYYCAECHGRDVSGTGPTAEFLAIVPPDLNRLALRNNGEFPIQETAEKIDGRIPVENHSYMPVFGLSLETVQTIPFTLPDGQPILLPERLADLIVYLKSVQMR